MKRDIAIQSQPLIQDRIRTIDHNSIRNFRDRVEGVRRNRDRPSTRTGGKGLGVVGVFGSSENRGSR
jgi:hypothetical protein